MPLLAPTGRAGLAAMTLAIQDLRGRRLASPEALETFLRAHSFPLVEGENVTFVWRGEADRVHLRHWIYGLPSSQALRRLEGSDLWYLSIALPERSRVEYKFELYRGNTVELVTDPLNTHLATDPMGANSVVHAPGYEVPDYTFFDANARPGTLETVVLASESFGEPRPVQVYLPARFRPTRRYPLLVVHDGSDFLRYAGLKTVLDNLIHRLDLPPLVAALTDSPRRLSEYADDARHARFLSCELLPALEARYPLARTRDARCLLGASFGAVASLAAAWRHPGVFGNLALLSGSFAFTDIGAHDRGPVFDPVVEFVNAFRAQPGRPSERVYLACGIYESLIYYNRSIYPLLQSTGMSVRFSEVRDGHNWENWRDRLREGLSWLFPGPLWMVYE
ncbi:MAG TPA: alpha/beta hydrolase-fold protein [Planctomycetota bacterium]